MKQTIDLQHRDFFSTQGFIEFEDLLSQQQIKTLLHSLDQGIAYDLWRTDAEVKKIVNHSHLPQIACDLTQCRSVRLAYDQIFTIEEGIFALQDRSCIRGLHCGLLLSLNDHPEPLANADVQDIDLFPWKAGSGTFFSPEKEFDFGKFAQHLEQDFFLIMYAHPLSIYAVNDIDPYTTNMKKMGYVFGDKLTEKFHPLIYKRG